MGAKGKEKAVDNSERQMLLLDAAANVFTEKGFAATTIDAVADSIKVTKGSFYYYYRSKIDLFFAVHRHAMRLNLEAIEPIVRDQDLSTKAKLWAMCRTHTLTMVTSFSYQRVTIQGIELLFTQSTTPAQRRELDELLHLRDEYETLFRNVLRDGIEAGLFRGDSVSNLVKPLLGALNWTAMWYRPRADQSDAERERLAKSIADFAVAGVMPTTIDDQV